MSDMSHKCTTPDSQLCLFIIGKSESMHNLTPTVPQKTCIPITVTLCKVGQRLQSNCYQDSISILQRWATHSSHECNHMSSLALAVQF